MSSGLADMVPGHKMCCLCFEFVPFSDLYEDARGFKWDICKPCQARDPGPEVGDA